jgi:hypothetical protein
MIQIRSCFPTSVSISWAGATLERTSDTIILYIPLAESNSTIAIMLSKLRMPVEDASEEFYRICNEVYVDGLSATERTGRLRKMVEELLTRRGFPVDLKLGRDARVAEDGCAWYVLMVYRNTLITDSIPVSLLHHLRPISRPKSNYAAIAFAPNELRISQ